MLVLTLPTTMYTHTQTMTYAMEWFAHQTYTVKAVTVIIAMGLVVHIITTITITTIRLHLIPQELFTLCVESFHAVYAALLLELSSGNRGNVADCKCCLCNKIIMNLIKIRMPCFSLNLYLKPTNNQFNTANQLLSTKLGKTTMEDSLHNNHNTNSHILDSKL